MDAVLEKGISRCFPEDKSLQAIARRELLNPKNFEKKPEKDIKEFLKIKSKMRKVLVNDKTDKNSKYIYKLIFREPIVFLENLSKKITKWKASISYVRPKKLEKEMEMRRRRRPRLHRVPIRNKIRRKYRDLVISLSELFVTPPPVLTDGDVVFAILSQQIPRLSDLGIRIIVTKIALQICIKSNFVANIPHIDGIEYDTFWAEKFAKMIMLKYPDYVAIEINGEDLSPEELYDFQRWGDFVNEKIVDKLPRVIRQKEEISREQPAYVRLSDTVTNSINFSVPFSRITGPDSFFKNIWGGLASD